MTLARPALPVALVLALALPPAGRAQDPGAEALGPPLSIGLRGALEGESGVGGHLRQPLTLAAPGRTGGLLSAPAGPGLFRDVRDLLRESGGDVVEAVRPVLWPEGSPSAPGTVRVFVQGLNTPREDGRDPGADARLRRYLEQGYLSRPVVALHNATALEDPDPVPPPRATEAGGRVVDLPLGADAVVGLRERIPEVLLPARQRDFYRAARLRLLGFGAREGGYVTSEIGAMATLAEAVLAPEGAGRLHVVAYSDGTLIAEHGVRLAAGRLARRLERAEGLDPARALARVEALLRERLFLEYWGNATPLLVRGPRRLLIHDRADHVTGKKLGATTFGVLTAADVPADLRGDTVLVTFASPWAGGDVHNALTSIGPALRAMERVELGVTRVPAGPVAFDDAPTLRLWRTLKARGLVERAYSVEELGVDYGAYASFRWRT